MRQTCVLYGEIVGWETDVQPESDDYPKLTKVSITDPNEWKCICGFRDCENTLKISFEDDNIEFTTNRPFYTGEIGKISVMVKKDTPLEIIKLLQSMVKD